MGEVGPATHGNCTRTYVTSTKMITIRAHVKPGELPCHLPISWHEERSSIGRRQRALVEDSSLSASAGGRRSTLQSADKKWNCKCLMIIAAATIQLLATAMEAHGRFRSRHLHDGRLT